jgi:hypothetical protein
LFRGPSWPSPTLPSHEFTTGNLAFAVCFGRTVMPLSCVFLENARQRPHDRLLHSKRSLSCVLYRRTRQRGFAVCFLRHTAKKVTNSTGRKWVQTTTLLCANVTCMAIIFMKIKNKGPSSAPCSCPAGPTNEKNEKNPVVAVRRNCRSLPEAAWPQRPPMPASSQEATELGGGGHLAMEEEEEAATWRRSRQAAS